MILQDGRRLSFVKPQQVIEMVRARRTCKNFLLILLLLSFLTSLSSFLLSSFFLPSFLNSSSCSSSTSFPYFSFPPPTPSSYSLPLVHLSFCCFFFSFLPLLLLLLFSIFYSIVKLLPETISRIEHYIQTDRQSNQSIP